jgi:hypothetical protein
MGTAKAAGRRTLASGARHPPRRWRASQQATWLHLHLRPCPPAARACVQAPRPPLATRAAPLPRQAMVSRGPWGRAAASGQAACPRCIQQPCAACATPGRGAAAPGRRVGARILGDLCGLTWAIMQCHAMPAGYPPGGPPPQGTYMAPPPHQNMGNSGAAAGAAAGTVGCCAGILACCGETPACSAVLFGTCALPHVLLPPCRPACIPNAVLCCPLRPTS